MRINIAAAHRFHLLDLARELADLGHDVKFYSYVPASRLKKFGLKKENRKSLYFLLMPFLGLLVLSKNAGWSVKLKHSVLDYFLAWFMRPCDVYIALGGVYKKSFLTAKKKYDAITILEWGSKHILTQREILSKAQKYSGPTDDFINRSLNGYQSADIIAVPSEHVKESFILNGITQNRLIQNAYGVDLSDFPPTKLEHENFDVIIVGQWSYRKGSDLLIKIFNTYGLSFLHVGPVVDIDFPKLPHVQHVAAVDEKELTKYYSKAKIFILPSREEGLALVLSQAIASGLPVVCSKDTGGRDLKKVLDNTKWIIELESLSHEDILKAIYEALELAKEQSGYRNYAKDKIKELSWKAYGTRYNNNLLFINPHQALDS